MSLEEEKLNQNEWVRWLLNKNHNAELWKILAFWEKYREKWEEMEQEFWEKCRATSKFENLLADYENNKKNLIKSFEKWLSVEERRMLSSLSQISKDKFYKQYIYNVMLYSRNPDYELNSDLLLWNRLSCFSEDFESFIIKHKNGLKPGVGVSLLFKKIWDEWAKMLAREWKDSLQPWMSIDLTENGISSEWAKAIAREWKNSLQPWMLIDFSNNNIWDEWIKAIAKEWKKSLKPGIQLHCRENGIWDEWVKILAETWKDSLKPNMQISLMDNKIWEEGADAMINNLQLTDGVMIHVERNNISYWGKHRLKNWEWLYKNKWMHVTITVDEDFSNHHMTSVPISFHPWVLFPWRQFLWWQSSWWQSSWWQFSWQITFPPKRKK